MRAVPASLLALALAGCSTTPAEDAADAAPVALVKVARAEAGTVSESVTLYGTVEAGTGNSAALSAPVEASVVQILAPVGTLVAAGTPVARIAPSPQARLDLAKAGADARAATLAAARAERLRRDGLASDADVETARAAATSTGATLTSLIARAGQQVLRAPVAGYVQTVAVSPGDLVQPGAAIAAIARSGAGRARFGIDPALARRVAIGTGLTVRTAGGERSFGTKVIAVDPVVDPATRLGAVFAVVPPAIGAGEALSAVLALPGNPGSPGSAALSVPYVALLDDGGQAYVYVVTGHVAHRHDVTVGASNGDRAAITAGLAAGDTVVTEGGTALEDGMKVRLK
ncbi:MAG: efflux RND transporter periplasmic adaptor subunit [Novosphingobium sp.]